MKEEVEVVLERSWSKRGNFNEAASEPGGFLIQSLLRRQPHLSRRQAVQRWPPRGLCPGREEYIEEDAEAFPFLS
jgi:hypothetical protein